MKPSRQSRAAKALRTGLSWRDGRPRWEPSPSSRAAGLKGRDLKHADGSWLSHGEAVDLCERRALWAGLIRDAAAGGVVTETARQDLHAALEKLRPPADEAAKQRRRLLQDLLDVATTLLGAPPKPPIAQPGAHTLRQMVDGYFADVAARRHKCKISPSSERAYRRQSERLLAKFGAGEPHSVVDRGRLVLWYEELQTVDGLSLANANQCMAATAALFAWSTRQSPPWREASPATRLGIETPDGRLVFWEVDEEMAYVPWLDAHGLADLADALVGLIWTGASPVDLCKTNLPDLAGDTWRYTRQKTGMEGLPAIVQPLKARLARRKAQALTAIGDPFLLDPRTGRRHTPASLSKLHLEAKAAAIAAGALPESFREKRLQDCRDTCVTRLFASGTPLERIFPWTAHGAKAIARIARAHYLSLMEKGSLEMAEKLMSWAAAEGMKW